MNVAQQIARRDLGAKAVKTLASKGIKITSIQAIPGDGPMPMANASRGYVVDDNGTCRVWLYADIMRAAA